MKEDQFLTKPSRLVELQFIRVVTHITNYIIERFSTES